MTVKSWTRRDVIRGLAAAVLVAGPATAIAPASGDSAPRDRQARRRWALARMDEMAQERLRCRARFQAEQKVRECQAEFEQRYRAYNELYLEAARE
jgi:hypothetical protein